MVSGRGSGSTVLKRWLAVAVLVLLAAACVSFGARRAQAGTTFQTGDVFVTATTGSPDFEATIDWFRNDGTFVATLHTGVDEIAGMAFDAAGNLYAATQDNKTVIEFDTTGTLLGTFATAPEDLPISLVFNTAGHLFVGESAVTPATDGGKLLEFDSTGGLVNAFPVDVENDGSNWIDLAPDQTTMLYTSLGTSVKAFDVSTGTQLPDFATGLPDLAAALKILPTGEVLVADTESVLLLDTFGQVVQDYDTPNEDDWVGLSLDPDGTSAWAMGLDLLTPTKFDIATGSVLTEIPVRKDFEGAILAVFTGEGGTPPPPTECSGEIAVSAKHVSFGSVGVKKSRSRSITIRNKSKDEELRVSIGEPDGPFTVKNSETDFTLEPGERRVIRINFEPDKKGKSSGELEITSSDCKNDTVTVDLSGSTGGKGGSGGPTLGGFPVINPNPPGDRNGPGIILGGGGKGKGGGGKGKGGGGASKKK